MIGLIIQKYLVISQYECMATMRKKYCNLNLYLELSYVISHFLHGEWILVLMWYHNLTIYVKYTKI